jgi:hypothetical protein
MSRSLFFPEAGTLKFTVGSFSPLLSNVVKETTLKHCVVVPPAEMSMSELNPVSRRLLDLGGSGDCFFLAVNAACSYITAMTGPAATVDAQSIYTLLGLKDYTYIEDSHIYKFLGSYPFSLVVYREYEGVCRSVKFGNNPNVVFLFNDFPYHYLLMDQVFVDGVMRSYSDLPQFKEEAVQSAPEIQTEYPPIYAEKGEFPDDPKEAVIEDLDFNYLYHYVDTRYTIRKEGLSLTASDSKAYYKLRHNLFKTMFLNMLGLASVEEKPFTEYGIDSNRTPDCIFVLGSKLVLVEFTVVKRFVTSLKTKQSQNKYAIEVKALEDQGWQVQQFYPTLSLDEGVSSLALDVFEVASILGKEVYEDVEATFLALQTELNSLEFNISELIPELLLNQEEHTQVLFSKEHKILRGPEPFQVLVQKVGMKRQRDQNTFLLIRKNARALERQLKLTRYNAKFVIIINRKHNKVYTDVDSTGVQKNTLLSLLQNNSPECVKWVRYVGTVVDVEEPFKAVGGVKFKPSKTRKQSERKTVDVVQYEMHYRTKLVKAEQAKLMPTLVDAYLPDQVDQVRDKYLTKLQNLRSGNNIVSFDKRWFIFPILTKAVPGTYKKLELHTGLSLTDRLIRSFRPHKAEKIIDRNQDLDQLDEQLKIVNRKHKDLLGFLGNDSARARKLKSIYSEALAKAKLVEYGLDSKLGWDLLKEYQSARRTMTIKVGEPTRKAYTNRIQLDATYLKTNWPAEMQHFNTKKGVVKVCAEIPLDTYKTKVDELTAALWQELSTSTMDDVLSDTTPLGGKLTSILLEMKDVALDIIQPLRRTQILHDLEFISRIAYSILYYSNIKSNKEDFFFDSVGYSNVMLFVKGGKKILSHKKSRLFKLIFPIQEGFSWVHTTPNSKVVEVEGEQFCVWPWQTWNFEMLKKASELYYTFTNFFTCSYLESNLQLEDYKKFVTTKVLNMYSQRRKVEIWFGFFRYLYLNSMATHTSVLDLVDDMVDYEYDPYFSYCQKLFAESYKMIHQYASKGKIYDMMTGLVVDNFDLCAEKFDESVFMTMAPFDRVNEHLRNLRSVLKTHLDVTSKYGSDPLNLLRETAVDASDDDYMSKLASDDLMFDPKLTFSVGVFAGEMLSKVTTITDMSSEFSKIMSRSYTEISTSKGMRDSSGSFWGQKGHDVIFGREESRTVLLKLFENFPKSHTEFKQSLTRSQISYREKIGMLDSIELEFDLKDKAQWKGSREIYVMSETTKILQSPLEKFFKYLCTWTPNELIHKKSHVRPKFIHGQVFEFETGEDVNTYATLDCRKWAPKSNLWKYYYFIRGMSHCLPEEFVDYFETVWSMMFTKKVRIQAYYVDLLDKNPATSDLTKSLVKRPDGDYEMIMPYSFMMGIFNYLSSLLHAFSQLYFDTKIARTFGATFNLIAHSDDSGGVIFSKSESLNFRLFRMYEMYQKGLNHLMSKKKCALSRNFFEMISIMYANKRLIPMTHKFLANVSFEPKGKGWVDDISAIVSKVVEIFSNGGTMLQCYLTMLTMGEMIRKFYHIPRLKTLSQIPLVYGGLFNMHPIHLILLGADCQEVMLDATESPGERGFRVGVGEALFGEYFPGKGVSANYHIPYYKKHSYTDLFSSEQMQLLKLMSGVIPETTLGQVAGHYSRLKDPSYVYSLSGVDMCQIFVMTLFTKTLVINSQGTKSSDLKKLTTKYSVMKSLGLFSSKTQKSLSQFHHYAKASESITLSLTDINVASKKTCKPMVYTTFQSIGLGLDFKTVNEIIAYRKSPELQVMFPDKIRMDTLVSWVKKNLQFSEDYVLEDYLMKLSSKDLEKTRSSYCFIPSGVSVDTVERFWTYINFYCTRRYYISSQKPQYFTIDQFKLWSSDYDSLKHMYLLVKIALRCPLKSTIFNKLKQNAVCPSCTYTNETVNMVDEIFRLRNAPDSSFIQTELPFAVYTQAQYRSVNVWYGRAEFILYTKFGSVEVSKKLGQVYNIYRINSLEMLDQVHFLLKNFLITRGMPELDITYSINDSANLKLGFNDLRQPRPIYPGERAMVQSNTVIHLETSTLPKLYKDGEKFTSEGLTVDFEIYQNYDINEGFYRSHKLEQVKDLIFEEEKIVDHTELRRTALSSKVYEVLQLDPSHSTAGTIESKYQPGYLLGSERSLTRALVLADKQGISSYRSTATPAKVDTAILEGISYKDIPILDLVDQFSFARITYRERQVIERIVTKNSIEENQTHILDGLVKKLGMKPTMNALTLTRVTFSNLVYTDVKNIPKDVATSYMITTLKAALNSLTDKFTGTPEFYIQGNMAQIYQQIALAIITETTPNYLGELLTKLFMRAQKGQPSKFWDHRKENIYSAIIVPKAETFKNQCLFNLAILSKMSKDAYTEMMAIRQINLASRAVNRNMDKMLKKLKKRRKENVEYLVGNLRFEDMENTNYYLDPDEDDFEDEIDAVSGGDDPENVREREWDEDNDEYLGYVFNNLDFKCVGEDTVQADFSMVTIRSLVMLPLVPWLGPGNCEIINVSGIPFFETVYPGKLTSLPTVNSMKEVKIPRLESKPLTVEEKEAVSKWSGKAKVETDIFELKSEDEVFEYQTEVLKTIGIKDTEHYSKNFFKLKDVSSEEMFWTHFMKGINLKAYTSITDVHKVSRRRSPILPGFTGNLKDDDLRAELNAMFSGHAEELVSGNQTLTQSSYKTILRSLKRLYRENIDRNIRAYIIILLSTMKDCVISDSSDSWYVDSLLKAVDSLESESDDMLNDDTPPAAVKSLQRNYQVKEPYSS